MIRAMCLMERGLFFSFFYHKFRNWLFFFFFLELELLGFLLYPLLFIFGRFWSVCLVVVVVIVVIISLCAFCDFDCIPTHSQDLCFPGFLQYLLLYYSITTTTTKKKRRNLKVSTSWTDNWIIEFLFIIITIIINM